MEIPGTDKAQLRFLVVDDHMLMRKLISEQLRTAGFRLIDTAINGQDALDKLNKAADSNEAIDIVLLDRGMPVMSGMELLALCRADARFNLVAFVMLTGEREQDRIMEALKAGATSYIVKPVSQQIIEQKLARVVDWLLQHRSTAQGGVEHA